MKKLLIISLSAGAGHVRAAKALEETAHQKYPELETRHIDMAEYITIPMKKALIDSYGLMVKRVPELWGFLYDRINSPKGADRLTKLTKQLKQVNSLKFRKFVRAYNPNKIICTHFFPTDVLLNAPNRFQINQPVCTVITDYDLHSLWFVPNTDHYFVATQKMKQKMIQLDIVDRDKITISGIPVSPVFYSQKSIAELRKNYQIPKNKKVVLVLSGGQGLTKSNQVVKLLLKSNLPLTIIAIAGKNKRLENVLKKIKFPSHISLLSVGWTETIDEYMRLADVIVTKPGGITTTECVALGKPMIIVDPIPGQEEHNADHILSNDLGVIARNPTDLQYYVEQGFDYSIAKQKKNAAEIILKSVIGR
jgi:processive 1,2-diacylglycerol beta-glucosyltransferase